MTLLDEIAARLGALSEDARAEVTAAAVKATRAMAWVPNPGPQTQAYLSKADVLLYGGQAGGGKSHLELGWGINEAQSGIIFRREVTQTDGLEKEGKTIIGEAARYNGQSNEWTWADGKTLKLGGMKQPDDWISHAGRERDYYGFDEAGEFLELQVAQIIAWLRAPPGRRTRVILGSNPPRTADGLWLIKWFAPWLDETFEVPAAPGELRWAVHVTRDGETSVVWVDGPGEYEIDGETYGAKSYTFIPASLEDNPYRNTPEYKAQLQSLPEPLRSQLLYGRFTSSMQDAANQVIPTAWIRDAMERWSPDPPRDVPMCAIGVDCTGGGTDPMVQVARHDLWFGAPIRTPASEIPAERAGAMSAGLVVATRRDNALVVVDMGGGYGGPLYEHLTANDVDCMAYKGAEKTERRTADRKLGFTNTRSAAYWALREALDPGQPGGSKVALPPSRRLLADLTAPTFDVTPRGIQIEPKIKRDSTGKIVGGVALKLGRSPDEGDAVVMANWGGPRWATHALDWIDNRAKKQKRGQRPQVISGRASGVRHGTKYR